ncbi:MAG: 2-oxo acid dehydrogenase subunit E2 [Thermoplasmata archaeon]
MDRSMHAYRNWRNQLVVFDEVDVLTIVEIEVGDRTFPLAHVIRAANKKTLRGIHEEIRSIQAEPGSSQSWERRRFLRWVLFLPSLVRDLWYRVRSKSPHWVKRYMGTVALTAVGMFGKGGGWGIAISNHTLGVTIGGIAEKPGAVEGRIEIREYLSITLDFDHDIIDGAPAARFTRRLKELIECGYGLID